MGLRQNGPHDVWYQLDRFETAKQASQAATDPKYLEGGFAELEVIPYYRSDSAVQVKTENTVSYTQSPTNENLESADKIEVTAV